MRGECPRHEIVPPTAIDLAARQLRLPIKTVSRLVAAYELRMSEFVDRDSPSVIDFARDEVQHQLHAHDDPEFTANESLYHVASDVDLPRLDYRGFRDADHRGARGVLLQRLPQRHRLAYRLLVPVDHQRSAWARVKGGGIDGWLVPVTETERFPCVLIVEWAAWQEFA